MEIYIECECGEEVVATEGMAGTTIICLCGRSLLVPNFSEMRRLSRAQSIDGPRLSNAKSQEDLNKVPLGILYAVVVVCVCIENVGMVFGSARAGGPMSVLEVLVWCAGQIWLVTQIYSGNPLAALLVLFIPCVGPLLAFRFIIDHWHIAKFPALCMAVGIFLFICGVATK